jgi:hypothetical protein
MYTREIQAPRGAPIENGNPLPGTWNTAFARVDLLDIHRPYPWPLPRWLRDWRIKEWESFSVHDDRFFLDAFFGNFKMYHMAQIFLYDQKNGNNYTFRKIRPGNGWKLPKSLNHGAVESRSPRFFFRIHTWLNADTIKLDIDIAATKRQPAFTAHLAYNMNKHDTTALAVSLNFTEHRNMYAYKALAAVRGDMVLEGQHVNLDQTRCTGIFRDYKGFFPYSMYGAYCGCMGFSEDDKRYGFHIVENQARDARKNNENALWVNGQCTPLPPVRITMPDGLSSDWVIQDVDGMVDLVFTPKEINRFGANLLVTSGDFFAGMGYYNGVLIDSKNEQVQVHNQWGIGEKIYVRV